MQPTTVSNIGQAAMVSCGTEYTLFANVEGTAYSAGFGREGQLGLGETESVEIVTEIVGKAVKGRKIVWAGTGGQHSMIAAPATIDAGSA